MKNTQRLALLLMASATLGAAESRTTRPALTRPSVSRQIAAQRGIDVAGCDDADAPLLAARSAPPAKPSFLWAVLHGWLYMFAIALAAGNLPFLVRTIVNADGSNTPTPASIKLSGDIEAVDKFLTFLGVGFLTALSDVHGRRPLIAWSSLGFGLTCWLQSTCTSSTAVLFLADTIDGISSCMLPITQAYVADVTPASRRVVNLGAFQGLAIGGAFMIGGPLGGVLGKKYGPRLVMKGAAGMQLLSFLLVVFVTPESLPAEERAGRRLDLRTANPVGALKACFGGAGKQGALLRGVAVAYALTALARTVLDAQLVGATLRHVRTAAPLAC